MDYKDFLARIEQEKKRKEDTAKAIESIITSQKLPKIVDLAIEASPAFKSLLIQDRIKTALYVLTIESDPKKLREALLEDRTYRLAKFGAPWELPVFVAEGIVLDLLEGRDVFNPTAMDIHNSRTIYTPY